MSWSESGASFSNTSFSGAPYSLVRNFGTAVDHEHTASRYAALIQVTSGHGSVYVEGSFDGTTWSTVSEVSATSGQVLMIVANAPARYVRAAVDLFSNDSSTPSVTLSASVLTFEDGSAWTEPSTTLAAISGAPGTTGTAVQYEQVMNSYAVAWDVEAPANTQGSSVALLLQGSLDGVAWYSLGAELDIASLDLTAGQGPSLVHLPFSQQSITTADGQPARYVRALIQNGDSRATISASVVAHA